MRFQTFQGGDFTWPRENPTYFLKRDKQIATSLLISELRACGFIGSDEFDERPNTGLKPESIGAVVNGLGQRLRIGLLARKGCEADIQAKIRSGEPLSVGTAYPRTASRELFRLGIATRFQARNVQAGCLEGLLKERTSDELDVLFELVQSRDTLEANDATLLIDDIRQVELLKIERRTPTTGAL